MKLRKVVVGCALLWGVTAANALSLGRLSGVALLGRPLDLVVPVRLDQPDDAAQQCFDADVFHADTRVSASRVMVRLEPGPTPQQAVLRIRSSALVDEPVVTVYLQAGCQQRVSRRFVLLAELPPDAAPVGVTAATGPARAPEVAPPASLAPRPATAAALPPEVARRPQGTEEPRSRVAPARQTDKPAPVVRTAPPPAPRPPARARLRLDPWDLVAERDPTLRASPELLSTPSDNPQDRANAAALWRALNAQPQDVLRDAERIQSLETDVKALREMFAANQASLNGLRGELEHARAERYANGLVYSLLALLVAMAAGGWWLWHRRPAHASPRAWWRRDDWAGDSLREMEADAVAEPTQWSSPPVAPGGDEPTDFQDIEPDLHERSARPAAKAVAQRPEPAHSDFDLSTTGGVRAMKTEELLDIQQQSDFFMSLGQHDQAIAVLRNHISQSGEEAGALAYLDLLEIYHRLGRRADYDMLRAEFNRVFNAQAPLFDEFSETSRGLADYPRALHRIEHLWPSPKVLAVIEESLFRKPGTDDSERFELEAYRELLLLYTLARQIMQPARADFEPSGFGSSQFVSTVIQPLLAQQVDNAPGATDGAHQPGAPLLEWVLPSDQAGSMGLDIDLASLAPPPEEDLEFEPWIEPPRVTAPASNPPPEAPDPFDLATQRLATPRRPPMH